jgi:hypothetical protein
MYRAIGSMFQNLKIFIAGNFEMLFWASALVALFFMPAAHAGPTFCPLHWLGFKYCPGCGIGHAIHYALHFEWKKSFQSHPAGIPGVIIILLRVKQLVYPKTHKI